MDVIEKTAGLNYEAEYHQLLKELEKQKEENVYLREELRSKEYELQYYLGFKEAVNIIFRGANL